MIEDSVVQERLEIPVSQASESASNLPRVKVPLRTKITLPFLILAVFLAVGSAYVVTQIVFDTIDERYTNQLIESGKLASEGMVRQETDLLKSLRLLSHAVGVAEAIEVGDTQRLGALAYGITANQQEEIVEFLDTQGQLVLSMRHQPEGSAVDYEFSAGGGGAYQEWPFVRKVLDRQVDELGDKYSGVARVAGEDIFYVAGPVYNQQEGFAGVVLVGRTLSTLLDQIHKETFAQVTVYDQDGLPVTSTLIEPLTLDSEQALLVLDKQDFSSLQRNLGKQRELKVSHIDYEEILSAWEGRGDEDLGVIGIALARTFLVRASRATRIQITMLVSLALFLVIVLGVNIANIITRPLSNLVQASSDVAQGNLEVQVEPKGHDEVSVLTQSFNQMVSSLYQSKMDLLKAYDSTLEGWSTALELRDRETEGHTQRVTDMTLDLARLMGIDGEELIHIRRGSLLHDIGKMGIPDSILLKPDSLTAEEWVIMRMHPIYAYEMLWGIEYLRPAVDIPYCHHERWDGTGYPRGILSAEIPIAARIFAIIDVWDAMRSDRPYRQALPVDVVCQYVSSSSGKHFDPQVVEAFFELLNQQPCEGEPGYEWLR